jgi:hypothetical protein
MNEKAPYCILAALCLSFLGIAANAQSNSPAAASVAKPAVVPPKAAVNYSRLPLSFEPNMGQTSKDVQWLAHGPEYTLFLAGHDAVLELNKVAPVTPGKMEQKKITSLALRMNLRGANAAERTTGEELLPGKANYFTSRNPEKWQRNVPMYGKVRLDKVYPGVDLVYYGETGRLEYDFVVAPGADPAAIRLSFDGATPHLADNGDLILPVDGTDVRFEKPVVYQIKDGKHQPVEGSFAIAEDKQITFNLGAYDKSRKLVIDPTLLFVGTLGTGSVGTVPNGMAVDASGETIITGYTRDLDFPVTSGALQTQCQTYSAAASGNITRCGPNDGAQTSAFVTKISADGTSLVYSTYLHGGGGQESGQSVVADAAGDAYVLGATSSNDFPITANAYESLCQPYYSNSVEISECDSTTINGYGDNGPVMFVVKLNPTGSAILYGTFFGGTYAVYPVQLALDSSSNIYFTGYLQLAQTASNYYPNSPNVPFPVTSGAYQQYGIGVQVPTLSELSADGKTLLYSTLIGSQNTSGFFPTSEPYALAVGPNGIAYLGGQTLAADFPTTPGVVRPTCTVSTASSDNCAAYTAFLSAFDTTKAGSASLLYSTYIGGTEVPIGNSAEQQVQGLAADSSNNVYVTGFSSTIDFPTTKGAYQTTCTVFSNSGTCNPTGFVQKINPTGTAYVWSTLYGGDNTEGEYGNPEAIALDAKGRVYIYGQSRFGGGDFVNPVEGYYGGGDKIFVATFSADGSQLEFGTHLASLATTASESDEPVAGGGFALDTTGNIYFVGYGADNGTFVSSSGVYSDTSVGAGYRAYFGKISPVLTPSTTALTIGPSPAYAGGPITFTAVVTSPSQTTPVPTGTVVFTNTVTSPATQLGTATVDDSGTATFTTSSLTAGTYGITAAYSGDAEYEPNTTAVQSLTVVAPPAPTATKTTLAASSASVAPGASVTFTSTTTGTTGTAAPTGSVTFLDGTTSLGTGTLNASGVATFTTTSLAAGSQSITSSYAGDASNAPSISGAVTVVVTAPVSGFTLSLSSSSASIASGATTPTTVTVTPDNGFSAATTFACSGLPANSTCSFSPATVTPSGTAATTTLTIATGVSTSVASLDRNAVDRGMTHSGSMAKIGLAGSGAMLALLFWPGFMNRRRGAQWLRTLGVVLLAMGAMHVMSGCSGGSKSTTPPNGATPAGSSTVTITATSGSLSQTASFTLTVQ